jgi:tRNA(Ile)-lysidine synthase
MPDLLIERVLKTIRSYEMIRPHDRVLAAVSGGPDSVFMLRALNQLKRKLKLSEIAVCNLDHGLRGEESEGDSSFVMKLASNLGMRCAQKRIDTRSVKAKKLSTEEAARGARYKFFTEAAAKFESNVIATGHTIDDQAETVIMRLIRGASLKGIVGIAPVRCEGSCRIIRPLIELEKKEITDYLDAQKVPYRTDSTNLGDAYFRNTVRHEILPFLERYNPRLKRALFNLADHLREDFDFIQARKPASLLSASAGGKSGLSIELKDLVAQPRAIQKEIMRDMLEHSGGMVKKLSFRHWKEMDALIRQKGKGSSVHLPGSIKVTKNARALVFRPV